MSISYFYHLYIVTYNTLYTENISGDINNIHMWNAEVISFHMS